MLHSQVLVPCNFLTVTPPLGDNYASKCSSDKFPQTKYTSPCVEHCPELHCNALLVSNFAEKVMKWRKTVGQIGPIVFLAFHAFSPVLENNETSKCGSESFPRIWHIFCVWKNCPSYLLTHSCLPIVGRLFYNLRKIHGPRIWEGKHTRANLGLLYNHSSNKEFLKNNWAFS